MRTLLLLCSAATLAGCSTLRGGDKPPSVALSEPAAAQAAEAEPMQAPPAAVEIIAVPTPLPLPGQLKPVPDGPRGRGEPRDPRARVEAANADARVQPTRAGYINAVQVWPWSEGALYQVYTAPGQVTDIALQPGERLTGSGPVAAGDTTRWVIGDTESGSGPGRRVHILVKPRRAGLTTNLVINTERRTYHIELRSAERTYMASVSWTYPQDELIALRRSAELAEAGQPVAIGTLDTLAALNFRYRIEGDRPPWRPVRAFDDGRQVFVEFPAGIAQGEMPPLWVVGEGGTAELVNYRVRGRYIVVDRLFAAAELRLGAKRQQRVRIERIGRAAR